MDMISVAMMGVLQSTNEMTNSSKALAVHVSALVSAVRTREMLLIQAARQYPHLPPETIIAACGGIPDDDEQDPTS
jgi:hypothetical protein